MNDTPAYPAARAVAAPIEAVFARQLEAAAGRGEPNLAPLPDAGTIEALVETAFWASLRREEGYTPRISLALLPPERARLGLTFARPLPLEPDALARLAPAVEQPGVHLGVWPADGADGALCVWGATRVIPNFCLVLEVVRPGLLVVKHRRAQAYAKFANIAVLEGDRIRLVDEEGASLPDCPGLLTWLLGFDAPAAWGDSVNVLVQLAAGMRAHGRGGSLLVVPAGSDAWRESVVAPMAYAIAPPWSRLADLVRGAPADEPTPTWQDAVRRTIESMAGLTAVDGAAILTDRFELHGFGAKIQRRPECAPVERIMITEPVVGDVAHAIHPVEIGGTRHLSAAQFVHDQREALALVASQDGRFTLFAWSPCEDLVHAHRVEVLLL